PVDQAVGDRFGPRERVGHHAAKEIAGGGDSERTRVWHDERLVGDEEGRRGVDGRGVVGAAELVALKAGECSRDLALGGELLGPEEIAPACDEGHDRPAYEDHTNEAATGVPARSAPPRRRPPPRPPPTRSQRPRASRGAYSI